MMLLKTIAIATVLCAPLALAEEPDIAILATVHAKQLRFTEVPNVTVTFPGDPRNQNVWHSDRENLPDQVQPYVTYRDIGIRLTITSTLPNIEQILNDALGSSTSQEEVHGSTDHGDMPRGNGRRAVARATANHHKHQSR